MVLLKLEIFEIGEVSVNLSYASPVGYNGVEYVNQGEAKIYVDLGIGGWYWLDEDQPKLLFFFFSNEIYSSVA